MNGWVFLLFIATDIYSPLEFSNQVFVSPEACERGGIEMEVKYHLVYRCFSYPILTSTTTGAPSAPPF